MSSSKYFTVKTEYGPVKGIKTTSVLGRDFFDFRCIPFMKAPLGKLRFRDAQPPASWTKPLDVTGDRPTYCTSELERIKTDNPRPSFNGTEDAGIITVATPHLDRNLPVVVYIHGGGFQYGYGDGSSDMYSGDYLLQKDVVYVNFNYRVGPIGFLSLQDPELNVPGNAGLKDQVFALKWVQKNIANFGGDPSNVTLMGTSAGAAAVQFLMVSDMAKGLFKRAVLNGSTCLIRTWPLANSKIFTERLAKLLGWNGQGGERKILELLENASAKDLVEKEQQVLTKEEIFSQDILFPFTPIIEPYVTANTFLREDPIVLARDCWSKDIDCIIGGTSLEGGLMCLYEGNFYDYLKSSEDFAPSRELGLDLKNPKDRQKAAKYGDKIKKFYFGDKAPSADTQFQYFMYAGDLHFWHGINRMVLSRVNSGGRGKTFLYRLDLQTDLNFLKHSFNIKFDGVVHAEDIFYLFYSKTEGVKVPGIDSKEFELIKKIVGTFTSFIISGDPNNDAIPTWQPVSTARPTQCMNLTNELFEMIPLPEEKRLKIWDEILNDEGIPLY